MPDPTRTSTRHRLRPPHRLRGVAGDVQAGGRAPGGAGDPPQRASGPRLHGLDLLRGPARPLDRARLVPLRAAVSASRMPTCCSSRTSSGWSGATTTSTRSTWQTPSRRSSGDRERRSRRTDRRRTRTASDRGGAHARQHAEHPEAERQQPHRPHLRPRRRPRVRGAGRLGQEGHARVPGQGPGRPDARCSRRRACRAARSGRAARSCSTSATSTASTSSIPPTRASGPWSTARCST